MLYEVTSKRTIIDAKGRDKVVTTHFLVSGCLFFSEAETAILNDEPNSDVVAISRSSIAEVINKNTDDDQRIFVSSIETTDEITDSSSKRVVALFAKDVAEATKISLEYVSKSIANETLVGVKKSKFSDFIKYLA